MNKPDTKRNLDIKSINPDIPDVHAMAPDGVRYSMIPLRATGERYETEVPETIDLAHRCGLALEALSRMIDPANDYYMWFTTINTSNPPFRSHNTSDYSCTPKLLEAFPLLRAATGDESHMTIEEGVLRQQLDSIADDGIPYAPYKKERHAWHGGHFHYGDKEVTDDWCWVGMPGLLLRTFGNLCTQPGGSAYEAVMTKLVAGIEKMLVFKDNYAYYPDAGRTLHQYTYMRSTGWDHNNEPGGEQECCEGSVLDTQARTLQGLSHWYMLSGDKKALELARKQAAFVLKPKMWGGLVEEISVCGAEQGHGHSHHHGRLSGLRAVLAFGHAANDERAKEFAKRGYEQLRTFMVPRIGWVAANGVGDGPIWMEGCCHGGLMCMAIRLSDYGLGDYWDEVDAQVRNMLVEQQFSDAAELRRISELCGDHRFKNQGPGQLSETTPEDIVGLFGAWSEFNSIPPNLLMGCCQGNAAMALGYAFEAALRCDGTRATVNLLVNRASPLLDVDSYIPYAGRVVLLNKKATHASVRISSWINRRTLRMQVNGQDRPLVWAGNFLQINDLKPGDRIELSFEVPQYTDSYTVHRRVWRKEKVATLSFRGSTCIGVKPKSTSATDIRLFERGHMNATTAPMKTITRFAPDTTFRNW